MLLSSLYQRELRNKIIPCSVVGTWYENFVSISWATAQKDFTSQEVMICDRRLVMIEKKEKNKMSIKAQESV